MSERRSLYGLFNRWFVLVAILLFTPIAASAASISVVENAAAAVPEPASLALLGSGLVAASTAIRRRRSSP